MKTTMKKSVARVIILTLVLAMMMSFAVPAMAAEESKVKAAEGFDDVRNGVFKFYQTWQNEKDAMGTAFLINEDHIITAGHCVSESELLKALAGVTGKVEEEYNKNVGYEVAIRRDVTIKAELVTYSENMDFAILKLAQPVATRKYLTLRDSSELKAGDLVWNVGFPVFHEGQTFDNDYTPSGVTVKPGSVMKTEALTEFVTTSGAHFKGMAISTNVELSGGDSGGPMIDKDGYVVGVSIVSVTGADKADSFYQATSINQVIDLCNDLGIKYYMKGETPEPEVKETVAPTEDAAKAAAEAEAKAAAEAEAKAAAEAEAKAAAEAAAAAAAAENAAKAEETTKKDGGMNLTIILIIAAVAVVAVIVVIVVVLGKKKPAPVSAPANVGAGQTAGFQTNSYTQPMGAGETTVLGGGAGETTILGRSTNGGSLIRKRTNETIVINTDRFVIGRERKTSNYCVADNSSVSRSHVTLSVRGGTTFLMDMNAANGTYVNGVKVMPNQEVALKNGDRIKLSDEEFEFRA